MTTHTPARVFNSLSVGWRYLVSPVEQRSHLANEKCGLSFWMTLTITRVMTICAPRMA